MSGATKFDTWATAQSSLEIQYSLATIEALRKAVSDGLLHHSRVPFEVAGILYGTHDAGTLRVEAMRLAACEHAYGPGIQFSPQDRDALATQLTADRQDKDLHGLVPVGWFVSHPRKDIALLPADLDIYNGFFPEPWQVALVVRPGRAGNMRAGFFVREADGTLKADRSYQDFNFPDGQSRLPLSHRADSFNGTERRMHRDNFATDWAEPDPTREFPPLDSLPPLDSSPPASRETPQVRSFGEPPPARVKPPLEPNTIGRRWGWFLATVAIAAMAGFAGANLSSSSSRRSADPLYLSVLDRAGQLQLEWSRASTTITGAARGALEIVDGGDRRSFPLAPQDLLQGSFVYGRKTGDVQVRMIVVAPNGIQAQEASRFVGSAPPVISETALTRDRNEPLTAAPSANSGPSLSVLQAENAQQRARIRQLERTLVILQGRLGIEPDK